MTTTAPAVLIMVMIDAISIQVYFKDEHMLAIMAALFI